MELTHIDEKGAKMVDVGAKDVTTRTARAKGDVAVSPKTVDLLINRREREKCRISFQHGKNGWYIRGKKNGGADTHVP